MILKTMDTTKPWVNGDWVVAYTVWQLDATFDNKWGVRIWMSDGVDHTIDHLVDTEAEAQDYLSQLLSAVGPVWTG